VSVDRRSAATPLAMVGFLRWLADWVVGHQSKTPATHRKKTYEPVRGRENVEIRHDKVTIDMEVAQDVILNVRLAFKVKSNRTTSGTVGALRVD
jgi:hypothetical protein